VALFDGDLFRKMFHDSKIAAKLLMAETKCMDVTKFGLAPHFKLGQRTELQLVVPLSLCLMKDDDDDDEKI